MDGEKEKDQIAAKIDEIESQVEKLTIKPTSSIKRIIDLALANRNIVLTIRVNEESNKKLNMLVDAGLFKSRSESAAFLIEEGIRSQAPLFKKITERLEKIDRIREELKNIVTEEMEKAKD